MPLVAVAFASYLTRVQRQWRPDDHNASKFVKAVKGRPINGYARVPVNGVRRRLEQSNSERALEWFGDMVGAYFCRRRIRVPNILVPIPGSDCTVGGRTTPRTVGLANAVARRLGIEVWDGLRWAGRMQASSHGGTRDVDEIYRQLRATKDVPNGSIVLVDDVLTSGAHLRAARAVLEENGSECRIAVCAGRTVWELPPDPFAVIEEELEDYEP